jgi:lysophospholipase L1-like esterase
LNNQTVRMIANTSIGGRSVRIRLSSALGAGTVSIGAAHIAIRDKDSATVAGTDRALTFSGKPTAPLYAGETLISDPVSLDLPPLAHVAVSLYIPGQTAAPTSHTFALHTTYISREGDFTAQPEIADATTRESYYWLAGIDVLAPPATAALVTFGDSITDGDQSTPETDGMWPAVLAARLQANKATANIAVVNAGISGNRILGDNGSGLVRLTHDALSQPGIKWMSILEGINDITGGSRGLPGAPVITAEILIAAYTQMIEAAHQYGVKVIGCTITPYGGSNVYNEYGESVRSAVNEWIRTGKAFDAVVDFDAATRDSNDPKRFRPEADSPDMLHPANPGYKLMGEAFAASFTKAVTKAAAGASRATTR